MNPSRQRWVLLSYRLPREPSTPRIAVWRRLRKLGAIQINDGLVALPLADDTREQLDWIAGSVEEAGGEASVWIAEPGALAHHRLLVERANRATAADYAAVVEATRAARPGKRTVARLRRTLRAIRARDRFSAPGRVEAERLVEALAAELEPVQ